MEEELRRTEPNHVPARSEEHTSELQSQSNLVCRLLLVKKEPAGVARPAPLDPQREALVARAELEAGELGELVDARVRDPARVARADEPAQLAAPVVDGL